MKYKVIIFAFCFLFFTFRLLTADTWLKIYDPFGDVDYFPEDIVVCQDGGYAVNGYYNYYDPEYGIDEDWGFLIKTDSDGNLLWAKLDTLSFMNSNRSYAFVETSDSGFISGISSGILIKRDYNGHREWAIDEDFAIHSMCNTDDGNIILGGFQNFNIGLRKIDENGNTLWTKIYHIDDDYSICKSIIQTQDGGYALTGYLDYINPQTGDILVMKTDENGDTLWTRTYDGYGFWDVGKSITEDSDGNIMVAGEILNPNTRGFLWYLDGDGNTIWAREVESSVGYSHPGILYNNYGGIFVSICQTTTGAKLYGFNANYNICWDNIFSGWSGEGDKSFKVTVSYGYVCALFNVGGSFEDNIGIAKTDSVGQVFAIDEHEIPQVTLSNYPNPFSSTTTIRCYLPLTIRNPVIEIYNIKGQCVRTFKIENEICKMNEVVWDGKSQYKNQVSSGIYFYRVTSDDYVSKTKKMILMK